MVEKKIDHILVSEDKIRQMVERLGAEITRDYQGKDLFLIGVLKGSFVFLRILCAIFASRVGSISCRCQAM